MNRPERRGRDAKIALRAAPISEEINPIKARTDWWQLQAFK